MSEKLIKEIKQKKPTLQELKVIFKKNKITSRDEIHALLMKHNLLKYVKKDNQFMTMKKRQIKMWIMPIKNYQVILLHLLTFKTPIFNVKIYY